MEHIPAQLLQALVVFHDSKDMHEAAVKLGITQPALSKQLKSLESRLPLPVLTPNGKRKVLTSYGEELYRELSPRFHGLDADVHALGLRHAQGAPPQIRIAARREILDRLTHTLATPGRLDLDEASHLQILERIRTRDLDLAISHSAPDVGDWIAKPLFRETFQIWLPKSFAGKPATDEKWSQVLQEHPCVAYRTHDEILEQTAVSKKVPLASLRIVGVTANYLSLRNWVVTGRGWGVLPTYLGDPAQSCWRLDVPAKALPNREFFAIYRKDHSKTRWLRDLLTEVQAAFKP